MVRMRFASVQQSIVAGLYPNLPCLVANLRDTVGPVPSGNTIYLVHPDISRPETEVIGYKILGGLASISCKWEMIDGLRVEMVSSKVVMRCWRAEESVMKARIEEIRNAFLPKCEDFDVGLDFTSL